MLYSLRLAGACPSKKNAYRRSKNGRLFLDKAVSKVIEALELQARAQWRQTGLAPLLHPDCAVRFSVSTNRIDRDGMLATLLDVLQSASVLRNDNVYCFNGKVVLLPALVVQPGREQSEVSLYVQDSQMLI